MTIEYLWMKKQNRFSYNRHLYRYLQIDIYWCLWIWLRYLLVDAYIDSDFVNIIPLIYLWYLQTSTNRASSQKKKVRNPCHLWCSRNKTHLSCKLSVFDCDVSPACTSSNSACACQLHGPSPVTSRLCFCTSAPAAGLQARIELARTAVVLHSRKQVFSHTSIHFFANTNSLLPTPPEFGFERFGLMPKFRVWDVRSWLPGSQELEGWK